LELNRSVENRLREGDLMSSQTTVGLIGVGEGVGDDGEDVDDILFRDGFGAQTVAVTDSVGVCS
jgi:hypothetical protein